MRTINQFNQANGKYRQVKKCLYLCVVAMLATQCTTVFAQEKAQTNFPLQEVRLLESPFAEAQKTDLAYMLKLSPDRLLVPYLREAGLRPKAESYGNWENTGLDGHTGGHYLTALAQMYASTGDMRCKQRLDYMVSELYRCQQAAGNGYVGGVPDGQAMWAQVKKGDFSLFNKKWVPWYNLHKLFAGLRDAYLIGGNQQAKLVLIRLTDWANDELAGLSEQQIQNMLNTEQGGMNEVCADVANITGNPKYLTLAKKFCHQAILQPLEAGKDKLDGLHANTQIPKVIGFERIAQINNDRDYDNAARFFWQTVVDNRSISIGGNSVREHFNPSDNFSSMVLSEQGPETCNSYNMLKLTKMLYLTRPDARYMDFYERVLYNHILSSQQPGKGGFVYFTPIRPQHYRVYSQPQEGFWCCVGTGMENHGKYGEMIYSHSGNDIDINLFIPSRLSWKEQGVTLTQTNHFPFEEKTSLTVNLNQPKTFRLSIRKPSWLKGPDLIVKVNGKIVHVQAAADGYVSVARQWKNGDRVTVDLPMKTTLESLPDKSAWVSIIHGPVVLAAVTDTTNLTGLEADGSRFGHIASGPLYPVNQAPLLVDNGKDIGAMLQTVAGKPLTYTFPDAIYQDKFKHLQLVPFFEIYDARYMLYWPIAKTDSINRREEELTQEDKGLLDLKRRTIDQVSPGEQQPESDHGMESSNATTGIINNRHYRQATGFFSYKLRINPAAKFLEVTYYGEEKGKEFDITINDVKIAHVVLSGVDGDRFFVKDYLIPDKLKDQSLVVVRFSSESGMSTGSVFDVRIVR